MDAIQAILTRRSYRTFTGEPVSPEHIALLKKVVLSAPTGMDRRQTHFVFVTKPELKPVLAGLKEFGSAFLANAPLLVAIADPKDLRTPVEDCTIAGAYLQLAAHSLGLGSCWSHFGTLMGEQAQAALRHHLNLPSNMMIQCVIAIGHPTDEPDPHAGDRTPDVSRISMIE